MSEFNFKSQICTKRHSPNGKVYALKGNEIYEFPSVIEAVKATGVAHDSIYKCCNGKRAFAGGYVWSYHPIDIPTEVEEWRDVKGYENLYQVNRKGKVRSSHKGYWEILTSVINNRGYKQYLFHKDGKRKNMRGNRLVAEAYIPNPDNLPFVNHKDENPANDCVENLEWCTQQYNTTYGTAIQKRIKSNPRVKPVVMLNANGEFEMEFESSAEAARYIGGNGSNVWAVCNKRAEKYKGKVFMYKDEWLIKEGYFNKEYLV